MHEDSAQQMEFRLSNGNIRESYREWFSLSRQSFSQWGLVRQQARNR
jgi:hypothetical protein